MEELDVAQIDHLHPFVLDELVVDISFSIADLEELRLKIVRVLVLFVFSQLCQEEGNGLALQQLDIGKGIFFALKILRTHELLLRGSVGRLTIPLLPCFYALFKDTVGPIEEHFLKCLVDPLGGVILVFAEAGLVDQSDGGVAEQVFELSRPLL